MAWPMAEVDTALERALEGVLARYGIPTHGLRKGVMEADRGDLSSDLADTARAMLPRPDPAGYEVALSGLYVRLRMAYEEHPEHVLEPARDPGTKICPHCGGAMDVPDRDERRCGGERPTDRCDDLSRVMWDLIDEAFPPEDATRWLACPPADDFLQWADDGAFAQDDLAGYVVAVMRRDAAARVLPDNALIPVDPARTATDG